MILGKLYFARLTVFGALCAAILQAEIKLPALISDHMVLQQGSPARIWGKADPGESVTVAFQGQSASTKTDASGKWAVFLKPMKPAAAAEMTVSGSNKIQIHDVLVGEVWVGSGQSNMQMNLGSAMNAEQEIARANFPSIRLFEVKRTVAETPQDDVTGAWQLCTPESARTTSAAGYFFSRDLHQRFKVSVGFIHSSWGGTPAQSWTSRPTLEAEPALKFILEDWQKILDTYPAAHERYQKQLETWKKQVAAAKAAGKPAPRQSRAPTTTGCMISALPIAGACSQRQ